MLLSVKSHAPVLFLHRIAESVSPPTLIHHDVGARVTYLSPCKLMWVTYFVCNSKTNENFEESGTFWVFSELKILYYWKRNSNIFETGWAGLGNDFLILCKCLLKFAHMFVKIRPRNCVIMIIVKLT